MKKYSEEDVLKWHEKYKELKSTRKVAKYFGTCRGVVKKRFQEAGLKIQKSNRKYFFNESFFATDTPESFYWAGFIAADGCILKKSMVLCLAIKDIDQIKKLLNVIGHDGKIRITDQRPIRNSTLASTAIYSEIMCKDLEQFSIYSRKSLTYIFPDFVKTHKFLNHFVRGYFDGDGHVSLKMGLSFRGTEQFLTTLRELLGKHCGLNDSVKIPFDSGIYKLPYSGRLNLVKFRDFVYANSNPTIRLERKYKIAYNALVDNPLIEHKISIISTDLDGNDIKFYDAQTHTTRDGFKEGAVLACVKGRRKSHKGRLFRRATKEEIKTHSRQDK